MKTSLIALAAMAALTPLSTAFANPDAAVTARHVLLISVDGLHQQDLEWFVSANPSSTLARTPFPSDSFPGMVGIAQQGSVYGGSKLSKIAEHGGT
jgi:hypothetical protein